ncbi:hypothetical protein AZE42_07147 [Rhizopogon vesiculosus]|uniref:Uncharacterized protein n=1 Tax=Rhizopogon vesiculosus TaxID=180088 RepID=A0A1J8PLS1_9AGAM|nr:hypothetical protein AZE42_07147 [Rhizopogon vesiculosus]
MAETAQPNIRITTPNRSFEGHTDSVTTAAVFPDGRRMVTSSHDKTLRLWDLKGGVVLKKLVGHIGAVWAVAVSGDGQLIASGDEEGSLIAWHGETGRSLTRAIKGHHYRICSLDFSPDGTLLVTGSWDCTIQLWNTTTWEVQGKPIHCGAGVNCIRFSPSGELVAIATHNHIEIWNLRDSTPVVSNPASALLRNSRATLRTQTGRAKPDSDNPVNPRTISTKCITKFKAVINSCNSSLAWTPDSTRLLSAGPYFDPTIREWDTSTWQQVGDPWSGHTGQINALAVNSTGTLLASASSDNHVRLWQLSDRQTIAIFTTIREVLCVAFSMDGKRILSGGKDKKISEWEVPKHAPKDQASEACSHPC